MKKLSFDLKGNLLPARENPIDLQGFEEIFVSDFPAESNRKELFEAFTIFLRELENILVKPFGIWVNGSFISKKMNPRDFDFVVLISAEEYSNQKQYLDELFQLKDSNSGKYLDGYILIVYPESHKFHSYTLSDKAYWYSLFTKTRMNRVQKRYDKGFVSLKFD
jgi:hypothetical protein